MSQNKSQIDEAKHELFNLLDAFAAKLAARGLTRDEVKAVLTLDHHEVADTVALAFDGENDGIRPRPPYDDAE